MPSPRVLHHSIKSYIIIHNLPNATHKISPTWMLSLSCHVLPAIKLVILPNLNYTRNGEFGSNWILSEMLRDDEPQDVVQL